MTSPSHHHLHRLNHLTQRLAALIPILEIADSAAPIPPTIAGPMRRTLAEASRFLPAAPPPATQPLTPVDFLAATLRQMDALLIAKRQAARASAPDSWLAYPRGLALR